MGRRMGIRMGHPMGRPFPERRYAEGMPQQMMPEPNVFSRKRDPLARNQKHQETVDLNLTNS